MKITVFLIAFIFLFTTEPTAQNIPTNDEILNDNIKTILVYPSNLPQPGTEHPAIKPISDPVPFLLTFDEINVDVANIYHAKIYHCTADWSVSSISEREYLYDFNEFSIDNFEFSANEKIPYTHFSFQVPRVKIPGNYVIVVYRDYDENDIVFSKRFMVFDNRVAVTADVSAFGPGRSATEQQIEFAIDYSKYPIQDPMTEIKVVVRQNQRWDNALTGLQPSFIHHDTRELIFRNVNLNHKFKSGNEFRFFDLRSVEYPLQNVDRIDKSGSRFDAYLLRDKFRGYEAYTMVNEDMNGAFFLQNKDYGNARLDAEYVYVHFFLEIPDQVRDEIYLMGDLTNWKTSEQNRLKLVEGSNIYTCQLLLKQGLYDYQYYVPGYAENPNIIEGNHFETRNEYEILVYYRHPVLRADILVAYKRIR